MAAKGNKALVRRFLEESNKGKAAAMAILDELWAADVVYHTGGGEEIRGQNLRWPRRGGDRRP